MANLVGLTAPAPYSLSEQPCPQAGTRLLPNAWNLSSLGGGMFALMEIAQPSMNPKGEKIVNSTMILMDFKLVRTVIQAGHLCQRSLVQSRLCLDYTLQGLSLLHQTARKSGLCRLFLILLV